jgi:hypothetical protein
MNTPNLDHMRPDPSFYGSKLSPHVATAGARPLLVALEPVEGYTYSS